MYPYVNTTHSCLGSIHLVLCFARVLFSVFCLSAFQEYAYAQNCIRKKITISPYKSAMMQLVRTDYLCSVGLFMAIMTDKTCRLHVDVTWCLDIKTLYTICCKRCSRQSLGFHCFVSIQFLIIWKICLIAAITLSTEFLKFTHNAYIFQYCH